MSKKVSTIFEKEPQRFGLRGDIFFWNYLKDIFEEYNLPMNSNHLVKIIKEEYLKLTGQELTTSSQAYCEKFANGGMSSGMLSGEFWITIAIPLLVERLEKNK